MKALARLPVSVWIAGAMVLCLAVYAPALNGEFIFDDVFHIEKNSALDRPASLGPILFSGYQGTRPLYNLSLALSAAVGGKSPFAYHALSLTIHLLCGGLTFFIARRVGVGQGGAALATALVLLHPVHTESVAYVNSRSGLLASLFGLLALLVATRPGPLARGQLLLAALLALAAVSSKESAAVLPALAVLVSRRLRPAWPLLIAPLALPLLFATFPNPHQGTVGGDVPDPMAHLRAEPYALLRLIQLLVFPVGQNLDHHVPLPASWDAPIVVGPALGMAALIALAAGSWWRWKRTGGPADRAPPAIGFAIAWFLIAIAPTNSVIPFADVLAERHLYLASIGPAVAAGLAADRAMTWASREGGRSIRLPALAALALALVATLVVATQKRAALWRDDALIWKDAVDKSPGKARPHLNLASALADNGDLEGALRESQAALRLDPEMADAAFNQGLALLRLGRAAEAVPPLRFAAGRKPNRPEYRLELAQALEALGESRSALAILARTEAMGGDGGLLALRRRAVLLQRLGRVDEAIDLWRKYLAARPGDAGAWNNLGQGLAQRNDWIGARRAIGKAVELAPANPRFRRALAGVGDRGR